jgi:uncharacterized protein (TIGR02453 family)
MAFKGWPAEAIEFYEGLQADNTKTYWLEHKATYEHKVKAPMEALLAELAPKFGEGKIFRPYRDVRFSADKTPYKTAMGVSLGERGYIQLSANGLGAGSGMYVMAPDQLERYRRAVADERTGVALTKLATTATKAGLEVTAHDVLKTAPRGYPKDHPRLDLLRQKGLIAWKEWPVGAWLGTAQAKKRVVDFLHAAEPLNDGLAAHVGPSSMPEQRGR